jgi:hypothetical protein
VAGNQMATDGKDFARVSVDDHEASRRLISISNSKRSWARSRARSAFIPKMPTSTVTAKRKGFQVIRLRGLEVPPAKTRDLLDK